MNGQINWYLIISWIETPDRRSSIANHMTVSDRRMSSEEREKRVGFQAGKYRLNIVFDVQNFCLFKSR